MENKGKLIIVGLPNGFSMFTVKEELEKLGKLDFFDMPKDVLTGLTKGFCIFQYGKERIN